MFYRLNHIIYQIPYNVLLNVSVKIAFKMKYTNILCML